MNRTIDVQIYLADRRGCSETNEFRSYHTFNFGTYSDESRQPFGPLCLLNDDMLRAGSSLAMQVEQRMEIILLPVVGGLEYTRLLSTGVSTSDFLEPGQVGVLSVDAGMTYTLSNPYETETINFLQLWLTNSSSHAASAINLIGFDLTLKNTLSPLVEHPENRVFIGQYGGREEGRYVINSMAGTQRIFVFVLQGSFEVANRLLHEKDGLALTGNDGYVLEFEALSNDAILILLEV